MRKFQNSLSNTETKKLPISGMTIPEISAALETISEKTISSYRAKQIFSWITKGAHSFREMTNLPLSLITLLEENFLLRGSSIYNKQSGIDGTRKLVISHSDNTLIETVLLPSSEKESTQNPAKKNRFTACLSTQVGCPMACVFCKTGTMGFIRNLETAEIVEQFLLLNDELYKKSGELQTDQKISRIVVMGMGEPLLNIQALRKALDIFCDPLGFNLSKRKITISTSGIIEGIIDIAENGPETELAVSLPSAREDLRSRLMPGLINHPLSELKKSLGFYQKKTGRRITIETVLLGGINTGRADAASLINFAKNLDAAINLIPWNPVKDLYFEGKKLIECRQKEIDFFSSLLEKGGCTVTRRFRRGRSIAGACGQLGPSL